MRNLFEEEEIGFSPQNPFGSVAVAQMWHRGTPPQERAGKIIYFRVGPSILKKLPYDEQGNPGRYENVNLQESKLRKIILEEIMKLLSEKKLTKPQAKKKEKIVKGMKSSKKDFEKRYPGRGEEVMYATATKISQKKKKKEED